MPLPADTKAFLPIHREAPAFSEQSTELEILVTGIKARLQPLLRHQYAYLVQGLLATEFRSQRRHKGPVLIDTFRPEGLLTSSRLPVLVQVVDLLAPYQKGGKIGLFGGAGVGKTVFIMELINNVAKAHGALQMHSRYLVNHRLDLSITSAYSQVVSPSSPVSVSALARGTTCTAR